MKASQYIYHYNHMVDKIVWLERKINELKCNGQSSKALEVHLHRYKNILNRLTDEKYFQ